ncbi:MAG: AAA family ATPase [Candidatus Limnocylindrales bacterium]
MQDITARPAMPGDALVLLVGPAGSGKSTWAAARFRRSQVLSSDDLREVVSDDAADQDATRDAFAILHAIAKARLRRGLLTVIDATNLLPSSRRPLLELARRHARPAVAVIFDVPLPELLRRNAGRERVVPEATVRRHHAQLADALADLRSEGYASIIQA